MYLLKFFRTVGGRGLRNPQLMNRQGINAQLTSEYGMKFSPEAAQYATDHLQADYHVYALAKPKTYQ